MVESRMAIEGFRPFGPGHVETLDGRFDAHRLLPNGRVYIYDNRDESKGLEPLEDFKTMHEACCRIKELEKYCA